MINSNARFDSVGDSIANLYQNLEKSQMKNTRDRNDVLYLFMNQNCKN